MATLAEQLADVRAQIRSAAEQAHRDPAEVRLLAVSKTFPAADVAEALKENQFMFGENRVQELEVKVPALPSSVEWHLIGHLQSNKAAKAASLVSWIHSVDSEKLASRLETAAAELHKKLNILLEVNISGEESKAGLRNESEVKRLAERVMKSEHLQLQGLMTMAELQADDARLHATFGGLRTLKEKLESEFRTPLPELSMGMSSDFRIAIAEGATIVRIGTAIFGHREYAP